MVSLVLTGLLLRRLVGVERTVRDPAPSAATTPAAPEAAPAEPLQSARAPVPEEDPNARQELRADSPAPVPAGELTFDRPPAIQAGSVLVIVLDAYGSPAPGVRVAMSTHLDDPDAPATDSAFVWERQRTYLGASGVTDATGSVELGYSLPTGLELPYFRTRIAPQLALKELPMSETGPGELPAPVVILRLPATGTVRVRVLQGELAPRGETAVEALIDGHIRREERVMEGEALFPFVELGCELHLRLTTSAMVNRPAKALVRGPELPGEVVEADLILSAWPTLTFRVFDEEGKPLANAAIPLRIEHGKLSPQPGHARTNAYGVAEFVVFGDARNENARELLLWSLSPPRLARVWLPEVLETPTKLGTITLRRVAPGSVPPP